MGNCCSSGAVRAPSPVSSWDGSPRAPPGLQQGKASVLSHTGFFFASTCRADFGKKRSDWRQLSLPLLLNTWCFETGYRHLKQSCALPHTDHLSLLLLCLAGTLSFHLWEMHGWALLRHTEPRLAAWRRLKGIVTSSTGGCPSSRWKYSLPPWESWSLHFAHSSGGTGKTGTRAQSSLLFQLLNTNQVGACIGSLWCFPFSHFLSKLVLLSGNAFGKAFIWVICSTDTEL